MLAVLLFHSLDYVPFHHYDGGFLGVDVFFVLSGCLITELLLTEHRQSGRVSLQLFYGRRMLRLAPALVAAVCAGAVVAAITGANNNGGPYARSAVVALGYGTNVMQWIHPTSPGLLNHTWTLAQEEQFYLIWPLVLLLLFRRRMQRRAVVRVLCVALGAVLAYRALAWLLFEPESLYYQPTARADGLLVGCLLGLFAHRLRAGLPPVWNRRLAWAATAAGCAVVVISLLVSMYTPALYLGLFTVVDVCAAVVVASVYAGATTPVLRLLALRPLRYAGRISYGLYLYSFPVSNLVAHLDGYRHPWRIAVVSVVASFAVAVLSYHLIEQPVLRLRSRLQPVRLTFRPAPVLVEEAV